MYGHRSDRTIPLAISCVLICLLGVAVAYQHPDAVGAATAPAPPVTTAVLPTAPPTASPAPAPVGSPPPAPDPVLQVPVSTLLAAANGQIPTFDAPDGTQIGTVGFWYGFPLTMPVVEGGGGWLRVRTPDRPNGSTAWVRANDVTTSETPYRLVLLRSRHRLLVFQAGVQVLSMPAGVGKAATPTPLGSFFVGANEAPGPPGYGPVVLDTSAHSEAIDRWQGADDAVIAIHGPMSASSDARIGSSGAAISNGCIRLHTADQARLAVLPAGTPFDVLP